MTYCNDGGGRRLVSVAVLIAGTVVGAAGCASLVEDVASRLAERDVKALEQEFKVFDAELGLFRQCLKARGGSCQGSHTTPLPHTSQHGAAQAVVPVSGRLSETLTGSVANLASGHPARDALAVLGHPVVGQAAALHDHLRGHDVDDVDGFSVDNDPGADGTAQNRARMTLDLGQVHHLHNGLLSSLGTGGWAGLHRHCQSLLADAPSVADRPSLEANCRRIAFIRTYLEAYTRKGEFVEVDVQLAGAIHAANTEAAKIKGDIDGLLAELKKLGANVDSDETRSLNELARDAGKVGREVEALVDRVEADLEKRFGKAVSVIFGNLTGLASQLAAKSAALARAGDNAAASAVRTLVSDIDRLLAEVKAGLDKLEQQVAAVDRRIVKAIDDEVNKADKALSNVFRVSKVGFVSRDHSFRAQLPTIEVTLDPTVRHLVKVTDVDDGQSLSGASDFGNLGVSTDTSGVGTGSSIGAEIVRVFLEAVFDAHEGLPAVAPANQPDLRPTGLAVAEYSLPLFSSPMGDVSAADLSHMTHTTDRVAAGTRAISSRIIAGFGPFSLNNPPLEEFLVEIIATSVRHATAKATWCWYACNLDQTIETLEADARTAVDDEVKAVEHKLKAEEQALKAKVEADAAHVKLRLELAK